MKFSMIVAIDKNNGIGKNNTIPWHLPTDLEYFQHITTGNKKNVVIMGRKTWESIPKNYKPLRNRLNIIVSSNPIDNQITKTSLNDALKYVCEVNEIEEVFVIGGQMLYEEGIKHQDCDKLYITRIDKEFGCDRFFPKVDEDRYELIKKSLDYIKDDFKYNFLIYKQKVI